MSTGKHKCHPHTELGVCMKFGNRDMSTHAAGFCHEKIATKMYDKLSVVISKLK